jgi:peptidoglycan/xylan/chitin deacetylase (PgdA/CDA1 family)
MNSAKHFIISGLVIAVLAIFIFKIPTSSSTNTEINNKATVIEAEIKTTSTTTLKDEITHGDISKKDIIFTFDGGAGIESGEKILATLSKHHIKGTFFLTGKMVESNPDLVKQIVLGGNEIFSHTYDHKDLTKLSEDQISEELTKTENVLEDIVHISPKPYFRAPYGALDSKVLLVASKNGYQSVYWTVDARDWMEKQGETADTVKAKILSTLAPGNIYLMHVGDNITGEILDEVFTTIESRGYKIVSLTQGL